MGYVVAGCGMVMPVDGTNVRNRSCWITLRTEHAGGKGRNRYTGIAAAERMPDRAGRD